jgi:O-antigen ligase
MIVAHSILVGARSVVRSPAAWGVATAGVLTAGWFAYTHLPYVNLVGWSLLLLAVLTLLIRKPVLGAALAAFVITGSITEYVPRSLSPLLAVVVVVFLLGRWLQGEWRVTFTPLMKWALLLFAWHLLSAAWATSYDYFTLAGLYRNVLVLLVFTWCVQTPADYVYVLIAAGAGLLLTAVLSVKGVLDLLSSGLLSPEMGQLHHLGTSRFSGQWLDPNILSQTIIPFVGLSYALVRTRLPVMIRAFAMTALLAGILAVLLSLSRAGMVCLAVMLALIVVADRRRWLILAVVGVLLVLVVMVFPVNVFGRIGTLAQGRGDASINQRTELMVAGLRMFEDSFPLGVGLGNFRTFSMDYMQDLYWSAIPHNTYTEILSEMGIIGMILFVGALSSVAVQLVRVRRIMDSENFGQNLGICMQAVFAAMLVSYMFLSMSAYAPYWMVLALLSVYPKVFADRAPAV